MQKDFDLWNVYKKKIDENQDVKLYHAQEVWWCRLGLNIGSEQDGTGMEFERPIVIIRGLSRKTCIILPLTSSPQVHSMRVPIGDIDGKNASALLSQIRTIDTKRLIEKVCFLDKDRFEPIRKAVRDLF